MKCTHCGFSYEEETVCPICGTPAPYSETPPEEPYFEMTDATPTAAAAEPQPPQQPELSASVPHRHVGKLQIAILCLLSAIAALLLYLAVLGSVAFAWMQSDYLYDTWDDPGNTGYAEKSMQDPNVLNDGTVHKIGEPYDFGSGVITLKGAAVIKPKASFDASQRLVAFTVEVSNNTKQVQLYHAPEFVLGSSDFDASHFAFSEFSIAGDEASVSFQPGETYAAVFYYNLPNEKQTLLATVLASGDAAWDASAVYNIALGDIK